MLAYPPDCHAPAEELLGNLVIVPQASAVRRRRRHTLMLSRAEPRPSWHRCALRAACDTTTREPSGALSTRRPPTLLYLGMRDTGLRNAPTRPVLPQSAEGPREAPAEGPCL